MKLPRRNFLRLSAGAAALPALARIARAETYPSRPVRIIVGFAAGGNADTIARVMGQWLSERLGQPFVVENRTGAATNIATEAVARSPPDGYTLLFVTSANAVNTALYDKLRPLHRPERAHNAPTRPEAICSIGSLGPPISFCASAALLQAGSLAVTRPVSRSSR